MPYLLTLSDSHELNRRNLTPQATQGWGIGLVRLAKGGGEKKEEEKERIRVICSISTTDGPSCRAGIARKALKES